MDLTKLLVGMCFKCRMEGLIWERQSNDLFKVKADSTQTYGERRSCLYVGYSEVLEMYPSWK